MSGTYLFTDRRGAKVADPSCHGLASEFRRGSARLLDRVPLVDRLTSRLSVRLRDQTVNQEARSDLADEERSA